MSCKDEIDLYNAFHKLWSQHAAWTRAFIVSTAADSGDLTPVTNRLLRNPSDFAAELKKYYGEEKANRFAALLTEHLTIAAALVNAAKVSDTAAANEARRKWYANADAIAAFLASINPYWSRQEWQMMLYDHLKITEDEAVYRLSRQFARDVALYDALEDQVLLMADHMADGIQKQFRI